MALHVGRRMAVLSGLMIIVCILVCCTDAKKTTSRELIEDIIELKDYKKLLRTKKNVMILFSKTVRDAVEPLKLYAEVAEAIKGQATLAYIDCGSEAKKLCKKLKVSPEPTVIKHYKDGEYHKDYDRKSTVQSMVNFLKDPSGDAPWEEDETALDVVHIQDGESLGKLLVKEKLPIMVMFYAPWCGYCKRLKPDYASAATELKGHSVLAAMDVNRPENSVVRKHFNISGFPTLLYFENGHLKFKYEGENDKENIINFMKKPGMQVAKPKEAEWSEESSHVVHLTASGFDAFVQKEPSVLVMFYAPWCGHCKKMKPEYTEAAASLKQQNIPGALAAVDATKESSLGVKYKISGYPSVKYFLNGEYAFDVNVRTADKIEEFMKNPKEPPPPPPPETHWSEVPSDVVHLNDENFKVFLKRKKHVLVMFYAPWCGHCKKAKPEFQAAAAEYKDDPKVEFAAVDCTIHSICGSMDVQGYPTIKYFNYFKNSRDYDGGRNQKDFVEFMKDPTAVATPPPEPSPEEWWSEFSGAENLHHLSSDNFDSFLKEQESVLVMFYAPWCGHCKAMKPAYAEAASLMKAQQVKGALATVNADSQTGVAEKQEIRGYPTIKYFWKGIFISEYDKPRTAEDLVSFMKDPPKAPKQEL